MAHYGRICHSVLYRLGALHRSYSRNGRSARVDDCVRSHHRELLPLISPGVPRDVTGCSAPIQHGSIWLKCTLRSCLSCVDSVRSTRARAVSSPCVCMYSTRPSLRRPLRVVQKKANGKGSCHADGLCNGRPFFCSRGLERKFSTPPPAASFCCEQLRFSAPPNLSE
jgi:hypothetical protein